MTPAAFAPPAWSTGNFSIYQFDATESNAFGVLMN